MPAVAERYEAPFDPVPNPAAATSQCRCSYQPAEPNQPITTGTTPRFMATGTANACSSTIGWMKEGK